MEMYWSIAATLLGLALVWFSGFLSGATAYRKHYEENTTPANGGKDATLNFSTKETTHD